MEWQGRGSRSRGYGGRGSGGRYSGRGDGRGMGSGWQQEGHGDRDWQGDGGRRGGRQGDHGGRGAYSGRGGAALQQVSLGVGRGGGQSSGDQQDGHGHRGWQGGSGRGGGRHGNHRERGDYDGRGTRQQVSPAAGGGGGQPSGARGSVSNVLNTARDRVDGTSAWGRGGGSGAWGQPMAASTALGSAATTTGSVTSGLERMVISPAHSAPCLPSKDGRLVPIPRPDGGGSLGANKTLRLRVNNFSLRFDEKMIFYHYDVDVKPENLPLGSAAPEISKSDLSAIKRELFRAYAAQFPVQTAAYDGQRNLFSPELLPEETFPVLVRGREFSVTLKLVKSIPLRELIQTPCPREVLQGLDIVMRDNSCRGRISIGRSFYSEHDLTDLGRGAIALRGFQQSIKSTEQGLVLSVDYSVMAFHKPVMVLEYLEEKLSIRFKEHMQLDNWQRKNVEWELKGLKIMVIHREERRKFTIFGLTSLKANDIRFNDDNSGSSLRLVDYYRDKYGREIQYRQLPCLELSKNKQNYVPMEFCRLVEGQRLPKEKLHRDGDASLRRMRLPKPWERRNKISNLMTSEDGPGRGNILDEFRVSVSSEMATATGRVLELPPLKLSSASGRPIRFVIQNVDGQWNLLRNKVSSGREIYQWGIADFSPSRQGPQGLQLEPFIVKLTKRCNDLGITMNCEPAFVGKYNMDVLSDPHQLRDVLNEVKRKTGGHLQILICPMAEQHEGYKSLKLIAETEVGILTQCCLSYHAAQGKDQYLANLGLKINAKLGGSNFELYDQLPIVGDMNSPVMLIGADVNHPSSWNTTCPSIAAAVGTINWPAANSYISEVRAQPHRRESIVDIGSMCRRLVDKFAQANNNSKPQKIIYFRDGVSDSQFDMVLNEELRDIKAAIESEDYKPTITVVVAQKRHHTRFFPENSKDPLCTRTGNVPPGTVVDRGIVVPCLFNFYLCSHNGILGTSKPTHYYVLWDENGFTSNSMHKLTYNLCFTFSRCTKPVSLVPPVYYADLLAYRGRLYYEGMLLQSASSSASSSSSLASSPSFDIASFPELHVDVKDVMYFV
ncbi:hypothetical protein Taro_037521 [Colocasia esculenta]|uniref:Uncharacterized protein n=1 Tax=Colocasia esculenta TaxID=4460 RepID=A0A843WBB9_COLES|nr:hypothetical protein [Colocasia esculenta]